MQNSIFDKIKNANSITILTHAKTDGDAVGSALAFFYYAKEQGKEPTILIDSAIPSNLLWLPGIENINAKKVNGGDLAITVDCATAERLGRNKFKLSSFKDTISVDHHQDNDRFAKLNLVKPGYSSTAEYIYDLFVKHDQDISPDVARNILVGILTDTGGLKFNSATPDTFRKVASLLEVVDKKVDYFSLPLFQSLPHKLFMLKKYAYDNVKFYNNNEVAIFELSHEDLLRLGVDITDTKIILDIALSLDSTKLVGAICEDEIGVNYVSLRSKCDIDVSKIATKFGGGGHVQASGCKIISDFKNATKIITDALVKGLK
ncbi:MAG: bifunctional oligoribonuclease/PAP phosphatase NrnA [bacterium]|nr:bifunctional oligoribonuclease/PAP phosphatase NrnA [bacterium]